MTGPAEEPTTAEIEAREAVLKSKVTVTVGSFGRQSSNGLSAIDAYNLSRDVCRVTNAVLDEHIPNPVPFLNLSVRGAGAREPITNGKIPDGCATAHFTSAYQVLRLGNDGLLDVVIAVGLTSLPVAPSDALTFFPGLASNTSSLIYVSRYAHDIGEEQISRYVPGYLGKTLEVVMTHVRRVMIWSNMGDGSDLARTVVSAIDTVLNRLM